MIKHIVSVILITGTLVLAACGQKGALYYDDGYYDYGIAEEYYYAFPGYYPIGYYYYPGCEGHHCGEYHKNDEGRWGYGGEGHPEGMHEEGHAGRFGGGGGHR